MKNVSDNQKQRQEKIVYYQYQFDFIAHHSRPQLIMKCDELKQYKNAKC